MSIGPEKRGPSEQTERVLRVGMLRSALESAPYAIAYATADGICDFANAALRALVRHRGRVPDRTPVELVFGPPAGSQIRRGLEVCLESGAPQDVTVSLPELKLPARVRADSELEYEVWLESVHSTVAEV